MIQIRCPGCASLLRIREELRGKTGACPKCKGRVHIPGSASGFDVIEDDEKPIPVVRAKPVKKMAGVGAASGFEIVDDDEPVATRKLKKVNSASPARRDNEVDEEPEDDRPRRVKRRKRKRWRYSDDDKTLMIICGIGLVLCTVFTLLGYFHYLLVYFGMAIAGMMAFVGHMWSYKIVAEEGLGHTVLFRYVPFYSVVFLLTRWDDMKQPFFLNLGGAILLFLSFFIGHIIALQNPNNHAAIQKNLFGNEKAMPQINQPDDKPDDDQ